MVGRLILFLVAATASIAASAASWERYQNERFGYEVAIPPGFPMIREADNSDGGWSSSPNGDADLKVWGTNLLDRSFPDEIASRIKSDTSAGWAISYRVVKPTNAVWSGKKGARIVYVRAIPVCSDQAAFVRIEYDSDQKSDFDRVVSHLAGSLRQFVVCQ